jgi:hypothetical protein
MSKFEFVYKDFELNNEILESKTQKFEDETQILEVL